ncbi:Hypothetical predicted protein [Paramuricea clavata]|uniref:Uncharacterized protein n=1 Tax=Paramuricea clavata TaxID=317549 RepID=A0A7D9ICY6_PARCT|nr:Hypothetical predicted protein [Paramuricea clavata]
MVFAGTFAQCLKKQVQISRCDNMNNELKGSQERIQNLKGCLEAECIKMSESPNKKGCKDPPKKVIPGFNALSINKTLTVENFLKEIAKRIAIHIIHNKDIRQHFKSVKCYKDTKLVKYQLNKMKSWIRKTQRNLGFSEVVQSSLPPKLATTGAKSPKDWYDVEIQMLTNLMKDVNDMRGYFKSSKTCIIPAC